MSILPQKISELPEVDVVAPADIFVTVDKSDLTSSPEGKTKQIRFEYIKQNVLNSVRIPKATSTTIGGVSVGSGLLLSSAGQLSTEFSGSYLDLSDTPPQVSSLGDLENVTITSARSGDVLTYDEFFEGWINTKVSYQNLADLPTNLITENSSATLTNLVVTGDLQVIGTTISTDFETLNVGTSEVILNDGVDKYTGDAVTGSYFITNLDSTAGISVGKEITINSNGGDLSLPEGTTVVNIDSATQITISNSFSGSSQTEVIFEIQQAPIANAAIIVNRSEEQNSEIRWNELEDRWKFSNDGENFYVIPTPEEYGNFDLLTNVPVIPQSIGDLNDVNFGGEGVDNGSLLSWNGFAWTAIAGDEINLSNSSIGALSDVDLSGAPNIGQVLKWSGSSWTPANDLFGEITNNDGAIVTPPETSSVISFYYDTLDAFPSAETYAGAVAYSRSGGKLYYAHSNDWVEIALADDVESVTKYTFSAESSDTINPTYNQVTLNLTPDDTSTASDVILRSGGGITLSYSNDVINIYSRTYSIAAADSSGANDARLTLVDSRSSNNVDSITFQGADGLSVEKGSDDSTLIFRAPPNTVTQYTDANAKDAMATAIINGTHVGITWSYDSNNKQLSSVVSGGGSGSGTTVLYDLGVSSSTSNEAVVTLSNSLDSNTDSFTIIGSGGSVVSWNEVDSNVVITSTAPVQSDWNETDTESLAFIANKPTVPSAYVLPTSTTTVLGGVKIDGTTITIDGSGVISAAAGGYVLPAASSTTLGGIKIGSGLSIATDGTVTVAAGEGGTPLQTRNEASATTSSIDNNAYEELTITGHKTYSVLKISTNADAWVRLYVDQASMVADRTRSEGADPVAGGGVIAEVRTNGTAILTPAPIGFNNDDPVTGNVYASVTNRSGSATAITVELTLLKLEA